MDVFITYFTSLTPLQLIGVAGFLCYMSCFGAVQFGALDGNSTTYSLVNILAASLVAISLVEDFNLSSALIQGGWIVIGVAGLILRAQRTWSSARRVLTATLDQGA